MEVAGGGLPETVWAPDPQYSNHIIQHESVISNQEMLLVF